MYDISNISEYLGLLPLPPALPVTSEQVTGRTGRIGRTGRTGKTCGALDHYFSEPDIPRDPQGDTWGSNHGF